VAYLTKLVSFWVAVAFTVLLALQAFPVTGFFLMILGGMVIAGALVHLFLISLFLEALVGRVPRVLVIVPIAAYGGYYAGYVYQGHDIARTSAALQASSPGKVLDFDPATHSHRPVRWSKPTPYRSSMRSTAIFGRRDTPRFA
jgi:hypothetical protein